MGLTILNVAYVFAPVGPDIAGGAEQVLAMLDRALVAGGHRSLVVACAGSKTAGELLDTAPLPGKFTEHQRRRAQKRHRQKIWQAMRQWPVDVVHYHGYDFAEYLPPPCTPTLVTLHLPVDHYPPEALSECRPGRYFNCVSASQRRSFPANEAMLPEIPNGVPVAGLQACHAKRKFALALGRICPEKGFHHALDAAALARTPLSIAGQVFPYPDHERYFAEKIQPRLGPHARFLGNLDFARKRRFLTAARCLLMPSLIAETSSLVAMEAIACGTPVVAFPVGALPDLIEPGVTGFLVDDTQQMAEAIRASGSIDRERCREVARRRFSLERMVEGYFGYYRKLAATAQSGAKARWYA
jgi:glycosyltransferase involved in cell wall biosynthesis